MITKMTDAEKRWTKYLSKGLQGFSDEAIDIYIEGQANSVCNNLGIPKLYEKKKVNPLRRVLTSHLKGGEMESKENFFLGNVTAYSKSSLIVDI